MALRPEKHVRNSVAGVMDKRRPFNILTVFMLDYCPAQGLLVDTGSHSAIWMVHGIPGGEGGLCGSPEANYPSPPHPREPPANS